MSQSAALVREKLVQTACKSSLQIRIRRTKLKPLKIGENIITNNIRQMPNCRQNTEVQTKKTVLVYYFKTVLVLYFISFMTAFTSI